MATKPPNKTTQPEPTPTHKYTYSQILALAPKHNPETLTFIFENTDPARLLRAGQSIDSRHIFDAAPDFFSSTNSLWETLSADQRDDIFGYSPAYNFVYAHELARLDRVKKKADQAASISEADKIRILGDFKTTMVKGRALRDKTVRALRDHLGKTPARDELLALRGKSDTWQNLQSGLEKVADVLERHRKDAQRAKMFDGINLTAALVTRLRDHAAALGPLGEKADIVNTSDAGAAQREVDQQDGRVIHVVTLIYRAFRDAHNDDPTIGVPKLGGMSGAVIGYMQGGGGAVEEPAGGGNGDGTEAGKQGG